MQGFSLDYAGIEEYQNVRYPYAMIDYITEVIPGKGAKGYKNISSNEWFIPCHFPGEPIMPGFLQVEALCQMAAFTILTLEGNKRKSIYVLAGDKIKLFRKVRPGDRLDIETVLLSYRRGIAKCSGMGYVNGEAACKADFVITVSGEIEKYQPKLLIEENR